MKCVVATNNKHKLIEIKQILGSKLELVTLKELGLDVDVEETGETFLENSLLKAREICKLTNMIALADDTGLVVDALNGEPGVYSARYAGSGHDDKANREKLLSKMLGIPYEKRTAYFETVISIVYPNGHEITASGKVQGHILIGEKGNGGFGYDSIFFSDELNKSFAEATPDEKNAVSHRGRALRNILQKL